MRWLLVCLMVLSACGSSNGFLRDATSSQVLQYRVATKNFRTLRQVRGEAKVTSLFCMLPLSHIAPYADAMESLVSQAKLQQNQSLANIREDTINYYGLFLCCKYLTLSADVIEVNTPSEEVIPIKRAGYAPPKSSSRQPLIVPAWNPSLDYSSTVPKKIPQAVDYDD